MKKIAFRYGFMMLGGFILFFLFMHLIGLSTQFWLRIFNGVIHISYIYLAIQAYQGVKDSSDFNYLAEVSVGMYTSLFGVVGFTVFMTLFLSFSPEFFKAIQAANPNVSSYLTPFTSSLFIFVEGITISLIGSYVIARMIEMRRVEG